MMNRRHALLALCAVPVLVHANESGKAADAAQRIMVYKTSTCGCCKLWVQHLLQAGFQVQVQDLDNLAPVKERVGIPPALGSCHTAEVGGYFVEGHVPAQDIRRLLREKPRGKGLTVPGMPLGSPGMEVASGEVQPYDVLLVGQNGDTTVFAHHGD